MTYDEWEAGVPDAIRQDTLWRCEAYSLALFLADLAWCGATKLVQDRRTWGISDQLYRAAGNISSIISEGYSRGSGKDRARFYEYALGSARESRDWYYKGRHILDAVVTAHRIDLATKIIRPTLTMIATGRRSNRKVTAR